MPTALRTWRLTSSHAHSDRKPAVEVQQCPLRAEVGEEIGEELARRKWTWKLMQTWSRRNWRRRGGREGGGGEGGGGGGRTTLIKSNNPHLAGGEQTRIGRETCMKMRVSADLHVRDRIHRCITDSFMLPYIN